MKGFKNTTRTQYSMGGDVGGYAKGGMAKGAAKISKVMGEFKKGELHSGSKDGPKVTKPAQAKAIAMSEARKAGMKAPMKKNEGGKVGKMPPLGETMKSVRRLPPELTPEQMRALEDRFAEKKRPSLGETMESVRRLPKELTPAQMRALEEGSKVRKYAVGGPAAPVKKKALPTYNASAAYQQFGADLKRMIDSGQLTLKQANALKAPAFEATRLRDVGQQQQAMDAALAAARGRMVPPVAQPQMMQPPMKVPEMPAPMYGDGPLRPTTAQLSEYNAGGRKGAWDPVSGVFTTSPPPPPPRKIYEPQRPPVPPPIESIGPTPPPVVAPTRQVIGYRSPPPGMSAADLANYDTRIYAQPEMPTPEIPNVGLIDNRIGPGFGKPMQPTAPPMTPPPLQNLGQVLQRIQQKQRPGMDRVDPGFAIDRGGYGMTGMTTPGGPPPAGMAPVDPRNVTMMKKGGRTAMPNGKR